MSASSTAGKTRSRAEEEGAVVIVVVVVVAAQKEYEDAAPIMPGVLQILHWRDGGGVPVVVLATVVVVPVD